MHGLMRGERAKPSNLLYHFWQISKCSVLDSEAKKAAIFSDSGQNTAFKTPYCWEKVSRQKLAQFPFVVLKGLKAVQHSGKRQFLRARFYRSTKIRFSLILPLRESCWGVPSPNPAMRLTPLKNPSKYFFGFFKNSSASHPVFLLLVRGHHAQPKGGFYHAKTIQHTAPQPGSQNTHDRGRIRRVCGKVFCLQHEPSRVYPASHNRGSHTPHHNRFPRQRRAACRRREADRRIRKNRRKLKPDSPDAERVAQPLPAACRGGTGGGFRPCCPKV